MAARAAAEAGRSGAPRGHGMRASSRPSALSTAPHSGTDSFGCDAHSRRPLARLLVERGEVMHARRSVGQRVGDAVGDRELGGQPVLHVIEVRGLTRHRVHGDHGGSSSAVPVARLSGGSIGSWVPRQLGLQLDPVALDRARAPGRAARSHLAERRRPARPQSPLGREWPGRRRRRRPAPAARPGPRPRRPAHLDRLAVGAEGAARAAGSQHRQGDGVLALSRRQVQETRRRHRRAHRSADGRRIQPPSYRAGWLAEAAAAIASQPSANASSIARSDRSSSSATTSAAGAHGALTCATPSGRVSS